MNNKKNVKPRFWLNLPSDLILVQNLFCESTAQSGLDQQPFHLKDPAARSDDQEHSGVLEYGDQ
jgi:hypothetical protein